MCQIDWDARSTKNRSLAIATFFCLQFTTLSVIPAAIFADEKSLTSVQEDIPEEVLRAEIYTDARSPIDGRQLSAAEYTELMEKLRSLDSIPPEDLVPSQLREVIDLLKLRKFLKQFIPFIP